MGRTKYIMSSGLAFAEEKDMEKLGEYSNKGWHVKDFKFMGYILEKGEEKDYIYSVDYRPLEVNEQEEYVDFFSASGWSHVASEADIHLFRACPGTEPIYSDRETSVEKYTNLNKSMKPVTVSLFLVTGLAWILGFLSTGSLQTILLVVATMLSVFAVPAVWTVVAAYSNKWRVDGRNSVATMIKMTPMVFFFLAIIIVLLGYFPDRFVSLFTSMVIGGIALPTIIFGIMSLYHKVVGNR